MRVSHEAVSELKVLEDDACARAHRSSVGLASLFLVQSDSPGKAFSME